MRTRFISPDENCQISSSVESINNRKGSGSGIEEDSSHFRMYLFIRPIRVPAANARGFQLSGRSIKLTSRAQTLLRSHPAQHLDLFRIGLVVASHKSVFTFASASSSLLASLPPPRALSGLPPPLPPTMGAIV